MYTSIVDFTGGATLIKYIGIKSNKKLIIQLLKFLDICCHNALSKGGFSLYQSVVCKKNHFYHILTNIEQVLVLKKNTNPSKIKYNIALKQIQVIRMSVPGGFGIENLCLLTGFQVGVSLPSSDTCIAYLLAPSSSNALRSFSSLKSLTSAISASASILHFLVRPFYDGLGLPG